MLTCVRWVLWRSWPKVRINVFIRLILPIDYKREDERLPVSASCVTISNPDSLSSSETGVNPGIKSEKKPLSDRARCQTAIGGI